MFVVSVSLKLLVYKLYIACCVPVNWYTMFDNFKSKLYYCHGQGYLEKQATLSGSKQ